MSVACIIISKIHPSYIANRHWCNALVIEADKGRVRLLSATRFAKISRKLWCFFGKGKKVSFVRSSELKEQDRLRSYHTSVAYPAPVLLMNRTGDSLAAIDKTADCSAYVGTLKEKKNTNEWHGQDAFRPTIRQGLTRLDGLDTPELDIPEITLIFCRVSYTVCTYPYWPTYKLVLSTLRLSLHIDSLHSLSTLLARY